MHEYQSETRARRRKAIRPQAGVEFLDEQDAQPEPLEPDDGMPGPRWRTRAALVGLVALVLIAGLVIHDPGLRAKTVAPVSTQSAAGPLLRCGAIIRVPVAGLPIAITRDITRALPGIRITDAVAQVACLVYDSRDRRFHVGAPPSLQTRSLDARYNRLLITVEISSGKPSSRPTMQTVATGASNAYIIHNRRRSARRTVTVTLIAPPRAHIPVRRLHRMADQLARVPRLQQRSGH